MRDSFDFDRCNLRQIFEKKHCAFIMQNESNNFMCYVFHVEPSAAILAKIIEAACKNRYQKIMADGASTSRHWGHAIRDAFGSLTHRRSSNNEQKRYSR
uniref:PID domain-containing protein n=1 Tax=Romanomermis culicivorax TaxID=13658 RepID=A0A915IEN7_ROMCU